MDTNTKLDRDVVLLEAEALKFTSTDDVERLHDTRNSGPRLCEYHQLFRIQLVADRKHNLVWESHVDDISRLGWFRGLWGLEGQ